MMIKKQRQALAAVLLGGSLIAAPAFGQSADDALAVIERAAEALGGVEAIENLTSLRMVGYGLTHYQWGGGGLAAPEAPPKWQANNYLQHIWDLENGRYQTMQRNNFLFPFLAPFGHSFDLVNQVLDGDVAYNISADGSMSRVGFQNPGALGTDGVYDRTMWSLTNPVAVVRAALDGEAEVSNLREEDGYQVVDVTVDAGTLELAIDDRGFPHHVNWNTAHQNLGEVTYTTNFVGYTEFDGIQLPMGTTTFLDWRDVLFRATYADGWIVNGEVEDLAAPEQIVAANVPVPGVAPLEIEQVADRIWRISNGTSVIEFADHLSIYELNGNQLTAQAILDLAQSVNPDKPLTELIYSHHHFDHTSGVRVGVAAGLTIIAHAQSEDIFRDMATRPAPSFDDVLPEGGEFRFQGIEEPTDIGDPDFALVIYPVVGYAHFSEGVFAYQPDSRVMIEGDLATAADHWQFWPDTYLNQLEHYGIEVDVVAPVHFYTMTHDEIVDFLRPGIERMHERCETNAEFGNYLAGCPGFIERDW